MSVIHISNVAGNVPTVNQLLTSDTGLGYNRKDALFYGLKVHEDGTKEAVCLGTSIIPEQVHDRIHDITSSLDHKAVNTDVRGMILTTDPDGQIAFTNTLDGGSY